MLKYRKVIAMIAIMVTAGMIIISGCKKDITVIVNNKPDLAKGGTISFATAILPLLTTNCAIGGCHASGGHVPDLSADKAYKSLTGTDYINLADPENSEVYLRLTAKLSPAMPMNAPGSDPSSINELMLAWIKQGAKNN